MKRKKLFCALAAVGATIALWAVFSLHIGHPATPLEVLVAIGRGLEVIADSG